MPNYKDLKPTEIIGRILAHEMSLKDKEELHNKSSSAYKGSCEAPTSSSEKQTFNEELILMVKNFNKFYKSRSKERSSKSRSYNNKRSSSRERNCYNVEDPDTIPMSVLLPTKEEKILPTKEEVEEKNHHQEREGVEMIIMNEEPLGEARIQKGRTNHQRATQSEYIKLTLVNGYPAPTPTITPKEVITPTPNILKMKVLPV